MTLKTSLHALDADAARWEDISAVLAAARTSSLGLLFFQNELSWAANGTGLDATYNEICEKVARLLNEGAGATDRVALTLRAVKVAYESVDEANRDALRGEWEPRP